jgi:hypothetical protein
MMRYTLSSFQGVKLNCPRQLKDPKNSPTREGGGGSYLLFLCAQHFSKRALAHLSAQLKI